MNVGEAKALRTAPLRVAADLKSEAVQDISSTMNTLLADMFALYVKTLSLARLRSPVGWRRVWAAAISLPLRERYNRAGGSTRT